MEEENNTQIESAEDLAAEQQQLGEVKEDDVRAEIIAEYGFDEDDDAERIQKAVAREIKQRKALSSAIGQKIKYRTELTKRTPVVDTTKTKPVNDEDLDTKLEKALEKRDLEALEYPDDIKDAIKKVAKVEGVSVKKAMSDPYVKSKIDAWEKTQNADEAALSRNHKTGRKAANDIDNPPDVDFSTPEGRAEYDKWKADMIKKGY